VADFKARKVLEARSVATLFRGYEVIMVDAIRAMRSTSRAGPAACAAACTR
jgi:hypothetical protein